MLRHRWRLGFVILFCATAQAEEPVSQPFAQAEPVVLPAEVPAKLAKASGEQPACIDLVERVGALCFRVPSDKGRRLVLDGDLAAAGLSASVLRERATSRAGAELSKLGQVQGVRDLPRHRYWMVAGEPWSAAVLLDPKAMLARLPGDGPLLIGLPSVDVAVAWRSDGDELDRVMMVALAKLHGAHEPSITPLALRWDGSAWLVHGEAVRRDKEASTEP